ncbi:neurotensin receptor type 1-like [Biomphalaria glabrata]|uniref:Neurotensin receptor type 1-like n=1 Tax=Biomphalaria glabrata TaxID=6526 RepID=A0A9W3BPT9_BIOGL|nr:neurotensin receptor type 1-like [Biomphalaria glabrata]XP_055901416.1 neurotensin receptor type 1-like [Biomphalaria glabrata]XP_055901418.1 neurotensin receptor type 1-like [Biomphalaria glabrata]
MMAMMSETNSLSNITNTSTNTCLNTCPNTCLNTSFVFSQEIATANANILIAVRFITSVGVAGNLVVFVTICKMKTSSSASFLVAFLAVCDALALMTKCATYELNLENGPMFCKLGMVPMSMSTAITNWTLVLICVERFIAVHYPLQKRYLLTKTRMKAAVLVVTVLLAVALSALSLTFRDYDAQKCSCVVRTIIIFHLMSDGLDIFIPFVLITVLTIAVIRKIYREKTNRASTLREGSVPNEAGTFLPSYKPPQPNIEKTMSVLMIIAVALYFILNAPLSVYVFLIAPFIRENTFYASMLLYVFKDVSHALNMFLYFFLCRGFRRALVELLKCQQQT